MRRTLLGLMILLLSVQAIHSEEVELTGPHPSRQIAVRDYGATGAPAAGDTLAEVSHVALRNSVPTTYTLMRTTVSNAAVGSEKTLFSIWPMSNGILTPAFNILGGNVGIGTASPNTKLEVAGTLRVEDATPNHNGYFDIQNLDWDISLYSNTHIGINSGADIRLRNGNSEWMRVKGDSGKVGIGTSAPNVALDLRALYAADNNYNGAFARFGNKLPPGDASCRYLEFGHKHSANPLMDAEYIQGASNSGTANPLSLNPDGGSVGIGTYNPQEILTVNGNALIQNGALRIQDGTATPTATAGYSKLFASSQQGTSELFALDGAGNRTQLSSHAEPAAGFDSPEVDPLPWSMNHANTFIGKGQVVNMSRLVRLVEEMTGQQIASSYNLPSNWQADFAKWQSDQAEKLKGDFIRADLQRSPWIEIKPADATQLVAETTETLGAAIDRKYVFNSQTGLVELKEISRPCTVRVATGRQIRAIKSDCRFDEKTGRFYRTRNAGDVTVPAIPPPDLPQWIKIRMSPTDVAIAGSASAISKNRVEGRGSATVAGASHVVSGNQSAVVGGNLNGVYADRAAVVAGEANEAGGAEAVVLGGHGNIANGAASIASGVGNRTDAERSFVGGRRMTLARTAANTFAWGDASSTCTIAADHGFFIFPAGGGAAAIGTDTISSGTRLAVAGGDIQLTGGSLIVDGKDMNTPDYVFDSGYRLMEIEKLEQYLQANKHLPGVPSRGDVARNGLNMSHFQMRLLEKIEEQALYLIGQHETIRKQNELIRKQDEIQKHQQAEIDELKSQMKILMKNTH